MITDCPTCPIAQYVLLSGDYVQHAITDRRIETIPDVRDNWTRENVIRAARDKAAEAITRGTHKRATRAKLNAAQGYTRIVDEPVRVAIQDCTSEELRTNLIELRRIIAELYASRDDKERLMRRRLIRVAHWIELHLDHPSYPAAPAELNDNQFVISVIREFNRKGM